MTPSNPSNSQPLIYRIADALGVFHLVAPVNHTHSQAEITGLAAALAAKQDALTFDTTPTENSTNPVTSGGVKAALDAKRQIRQDDSETSDHAIVSTTASEGDVYIMLSVREGDDIKSVHITHDNMENLIRALLTPDTAPTENSTNLITSGGVKEAIDALTTSVVPIHQVAAILPKTSGDSTDYEAQSWLGDGKMALVLQTARPVKVSIEATGVDDAPDGTWSGTTDISFDLTQGVRTVKNIYDLISAQLQNDYPGERIGIIVNWKISVYAKDTVAADTACLINFYNPTSAE